MVVAAAVAIVTAILETPVRDGTEGGADSVTLTVND